MKPARDTIAGCVFERLTVVSWGTALDIAHALQLPEQSVRNGLYKLQELGYVKHAGTRDVRVGRGPVLWELTREGRAYWQSAYAEATADKQETERGT